jgi:chromosome segregation ATPase
VIRRRPDLATQLSRLEATLEANHHQITRRLDRIVTNQEAAAAIAAQLTKALGEIRGLVDTLNANIVELQGQVAAGGTVDLSAVSAVAQQLDDIVPDAPAAPTA